MSENSFDPADHNIADVKAYVEANPDQRQAVLEAEQARGDDARKTLVEWLESQEVEAVAPTSSNDEPDTIRVGGEEYTVDPNKGYRHVAGRS